MPDTKKIQEALTRGVENVYPNREELEKVLHSGKKLRLYNGIDPTGASLHLGHMVQMLKLRQFQELGHEVIVLIGDFTAQIGDPSDKMAVRKPLTHKQVLANAKDYKKQIGRFLDLKKTIFKYNSRWLGKLSFADTLTLASHFSAQQTLARHMFKERMSQGKDLFLHEFLYPMMQAYDSVVMDVDLEIGGNDQMFNMLEGRSLMKKMKNKEKYVLTTSLLTDPSGVKMGKTTDNMARLNDSPENMYGIILSWPDGFILPGFELLTAMPMEEIEKMKGEMQAGRNPKECKMILAHRVVEMNFGKKEADRAQEEFKKVHEEKAMPDDIKEVEINSKNIMDVLVETKLCTSKADARRNIDQSGIKIDGEIIKDLNCIITKPCVIQKGKRFFVRVTQ